MKWLHSVVVYQWPNKWKAIIRRETNPFWVMLGKAEELFQIKHADLPAVAIPLWIRQQPKVASSLLVIGALRVVSAIFTMPAHWCGLETHRNDHFYDSTLFPRLIQIVRHEYAVFNNSASAEV